MKSLCYLWKQPNNMTPESLKVSTGVCTVFPLSFGTMFLPNSLRLCVWHTVKQMARARMTARQKEGGRARGRKRQGMGSGKPDPGGREAQKRRGSRCVKHQRPCGVCDSCFGGLRSNPPRTLSVFTSEAERRPWCCYPGLIHCSLAV